MPKRHSKREVTSNKAQRVSPPKVLRNPTSSNGAKTTAASSLTQRANKK